MEEKEIMDYVNNIASSNKSCKEKIENLQVYTKRLMKDAEDYMINFCKKICGIERIEDYYMLYDLYSNNKISGVYFVIDKNTGYTKIGTSTDVYNRISSLKTTNDIKVVRIIICPPIFCYELECKLHKHYAKQNVYREWFKIKDFDDDYLEYYGFINNVIIDHYLGDEDSPEYNLEYDLINCVETEKLLNEMWGFHKNYKGYTNSKVWKFYQLLKNNKICFNLLDNSLFYPHNEKLSVVSFFNIMDYITQRLTNSF